MPHGPKINAIFSANFGQPNRIILRDSSKIENRLLALNLLKDAMLRLFCEVPRSAQSGFESR